MKTLEIARRYVVFIIHILGNWVTLTAKRIDHQNYFINKEKALDVDVAADCPEPDSRRRNTHGPVH